MSLVQDWGLGWALAAPSSSDAVPRNAGRRLGGTCHLHGDAGHWGTLSGHPHGLTMNLNLTSQIREQCCDPTHVQFP